MASLLPRLFPVAPRCPQGRALARRMIARLGIVSGWACLAWIVAGSVIAGAQPWQPRDLEPPLDLPAATGLTRADEAAMRLLIEAQIAAMRADDWPGAFALASPDLQAQYGTPAALRDDVTAHYAPLPAIASAQFIDIVTFRGLPTYRLTLADGDGLATTAYYLVRRLDAARCESPGACWCECRAASLRLRTLTPAILGGSRAERSDCSSRADTKARREVNACA
jgi:Domain of unknown function (DUF4864)